MRIHAPFKYYGGKTNMLQYLLPIINKNRDSKIFLSLFTGGAALEFAKDKHQIEVWNDTLYPMTVFYEVLKDVMLSKRLVRLLRRTLFSETNYRRSRHIYKRFKDKNCHNDKAKVWLAWAVFMQCSATFSNGILKGYAFSKQRDMAMTFRNRIHAIEYSIKKYVRRMDNLCVMNRDALNVLNLYKNDKDVLVYADPPYFNSDKGHYSNYSRRDFNRLLMHLSEIKGKFILSCYDSDLIQLYIKKRGWRVIKVVQPVGVSHKISKTKTECIVMNYNYDDRLELF